MTTPNTITIDDTVYVRADEVGTADTPDTPFRERMKGKPVIVRCKDAGVHFGYYVNHEDREVELTSSRRLWYWKAATGHTLSAVAREGLASGSKIACVLPCLLLTEACEVIECSQKAADSINAQPIHQA